MFRGDAVFLEDFLCDVGGEAEYQKGEGGVLLRASTDLLACRGDLDSLEAVDGFESFDGEVGCGVALG